MSTGDWIAIIGILVVLMTATISGIWKMFSWFREHLASFGESLASSRASFDSFKTSVDSSFKQMNEKMDAMNEKFESRLAKIEIAIAEIRVDMKDLTERLDRLEIRVDNLYEKFSQMEVAMGEMNMRLDILWRQYIFKSNSPVVLNEKGKEILEKSNIGVFADAHFNEVVEKIRSFKPENAYQAQALLEAIMESYKKKDEYKLELQRISFESGYYIESLLYVAALSIRDRVISKLGFESHSSATNP